MTLEWVGHIPGKRESRRFEGDYMIRQQDVIDQTHFEDTVAHGGWAIDLHPADGVYSEKPGCTQWHSKGTYGIPYRCYYSQNISNLFLAGRIISATHVAFGSTRVMATCGSGGQAIGTAAALCQKHGCDPRELSSGDKLTELQSALHQQGQFLPHTPDRDSEDLAKSAEITASSELSLDQLAPCDQWRPLDVSAAMLLPLQQGSCPQFTLKVHAGQATTLEVSLVRSQKDGNFTPEETITSSQYELPAGQSELSMNLETELDRAGYYFLTFSENPDVSLRLSEQRLTGVLATFASFNKAVATTNKQSPPENIGVEPFEFWLPERRPKGQNLALQIEPPLVCFSSENISNGPARPTTQPNAWVSDPQDQQPSLSLTWEQAVTISRITLELDPDWDHPMESVLMTHPEEVSPFMVKDLDLCDASGSTLAEIRGNHSAHLSIELPEPVSTHSLELKVLSTQGGPASLFRVRVH